MTYSFTHAFDELEVDIGGIHWWLSGEVEVSHTMQPAEPDVGIMSAFPEDVGIEDKTITLTGFYLMPDDYESKTYTMVLNRGMYAFDCVEEVLMPQMEDAAANGAGDDWCDYDDYREDFAA